MKMLLTVTYWILAKLLYKSFVNYIKKISFSINDHVIVDRKKFSSALEKVQRKNKIPGDLVRFAILLDCEFNKFYWKHLRNAFNKVKKLMGNRYISHEFKIGDSHNPYCGSVHIDGRFLGIRFECQVMGKQLWDIKEESHSCYKNGEPEKAIAIYKKIKALIGEPKNQAVVLIKPLGRGKERMVFNFVKQFGEIEEIKNITCNAWHISQHYKKFKNEPFFEKMVLYYIGQDLLAVKCNINISAARAALGGSKAENGFRAEFINKKAINFVRKVYGAVDNGIHMSDSPEEGRRELDIWFS